MKKLIIFLLVIPFFNSCVTREEIEATVWLNNFNDSMKELCDREPELSQHGFYRKLNNGKLEFISICTTKARNMLSIIDTDFNNILDRNLPKKNDQGN